MDYLIDDDVDGSGGVGGGEDGTGDDGDDDNTLG